MHWIHDFIWKDLETRKIFESTMKIVCPVCYLCFPFHKSSKKTVLSNNLVWLNEIDQHGSSFTRKRLILPPGGPAEMPLWLPSLLSVHTRRALT